MGLTHCLGDLAGMVGVLWLFWREQGTERGLFTDLWGAHSWGA